MVGLKIPALLIRSVNLKQISALNHLGLKLTGDGEIDLIMAYLSGHFLHVNVYEVKRSDTYPWETKSRPPNKQAVNKAENQLTKDVEILTVLLAGIPLDQIVFHTLACYPDASKSDLETITCADCLGNRVVCQEDLVDLSLLQKKSQVVDKQEAWFFQISYRWFLSDLVTIEGRNHLLYLTARCLFELSLLHLGYRELADQEHLVIERHKFNIPKVDGKMMQSEFVVASPQQQQAIASFTASSSQRCFVLTGAAGTGKTLVASKVANNLIQSLEATAEPGKGPVLLVTAELAIKDDPLLKHLDANTSQAKTKIYDGWNNILKEYGVSGSQRKMQLLHLTEALTKRW